MIDKKYMKICKRFDNVMNDIGCEHIAITEDSELYHKREHYDVEDGITIGWMLKEAEYWLSCYYESGHCRCDDRFTDDYCYKIWVSETGKLKRLIKALKKYDSNELVEIPA